MDLSVLFSYVTIGTAAGMILKLMVELIFYAVNALLGVFRNITK